MVLGVIGVCGHGLWPLDLHGHDLDELILLELRGCGSNHGLDIRLPNRTWVLLTHEAFDALTTGSL
jgi:hypothetical protein